MSKEVNLAAIIQQFEIKGTIHQIIPFGNGYINDSYKATTVGNIHPNYLLQRINDKVFNNVEGMMNNIKLVLDHLLTKSSLNTKLDNLELQKTIKGAYYFVDEQTNYWRVFDFKQDTKTYDIVETPEQVYNGAKAFGDFVFELADLDSNLLVETVPNFHNVIFRLEELNDAAKKCNSSRLKHAGPLISFVNDLSDEMTTIEKLKLRGSLPIRVTHNDTKFNNVLLDHQDQAVCVVDLDTVMPGIVHYDFGDGIRTSTNTALEDEQDLSLVHFDLEKFSAFAHGYLEGVNGILLPIEIHHLARAAAMIPYIMGVRFLTDYLNGDIYYKTEYDEHNYYRAACQLELSRQINSRLDEINSIVKLADKTT